MSAWLSTIAAARVLGVSRGEVERLAEAGEIESMQTTTGLLRVKREAIEARAGIKPRAQRTGRNASNGPGTKTLDEIGAELGLSRERVRQIEREALGKLRAALTARGLSFDDLIGAPSEAP